MDFNLPAELTAYLAELDDFIEREIKPLEREGDNIRFFDHRREWARTDWDAGGLPRKEWEELLAEARRRADAAGHLRYAWPKEMGGKGGSNLDMAVIREHLAAKGLGLHNDLQNEHSIVGNNPFILMFKEFATNAQYERFADDLLNGRIRTGFGLTEPNHGSDATHMETRAVPETRDGKPGWLINGEKMWTTGMHVATHVMVFARTSGNDGDAQGITCFLVPANAPGYQVGRIEEKMGQKASDTTQILFESCRVPADAVIGAEGEGYRIALSNLEAGRIGISAQCLGMARAALEAAVKYAQERESFGKPIFEHQAVNFRLADMATQLEAARQLVWHAASLKDAGRPCLKEASMAKLFASEMAERVCSDAIQVHGGYGYVTDFPVERIYRDVRVCQIYEGASDIQKLVIGRALAG